MRTCSVSTAVITRRSLPFVLTMLLQCVTCDARRPDTVIFDDFEKAQTQWSLRQSGSRGAQVVTTEARHSGTQSLLSETDRYGLQNIRAEFRYKDDGSCVSFWYLLEYDPVDSPDTCLTVGLHSETDDRFYSTVLPCPEPARWNLFELETAGISPLLIGDWIDQLSIGGVGRAVPLKLHLDDVRIENHGPKRKPRHTAASAPVDCPRALYFPRGVMPEQAEAYADAGINAVFLREPSQEAAVEWTAYGQKCGFAVWLVIPAYYDVRQWMDSARLRSAVFADGLPDDLVCPLQDDYWKLFVLPILLQWVRLSCFAPIQGILLDTNAVGSVHSSYTDVDSCLCDDCFARFLDISGINERIESFPPPDRWGWLTDNKLVLKYREALELRTRIRAEILRERIRAENGNLRLGVLDFRDTWINAGLAAGFGDAEAPSMVVARDPTFGRGYSAAVRWYSERLEQRSVHHHWVPGFDLKEFSPQDLSAHLLAATTAGDGYWIELPVEPAADGETPRVAPPTVEFLNALRSTKHDATSRGGKSSAVRRRSKLTDEKQ